MNDLVVDTNVFMHASNPQEQSCTASRDLVQQISNSTLILCVDEGFDPDPTKNKSQIGHEYITHIRHGSPAFALILKLASERRIRSLARKVDNRSKKIICQTIRKPTDRVFVCIAVNSLERILVSHDFEDFSIEKRAHFTRELNINIVTAQEVIPQLP